MTGRPGTRLHATAIAGIGATEFSKDSGRSELRLAAEAVGAALDDAGLRPADVDGLVTFTMDANAEVAVARELGMGELTFFDQVGYGGGAACGTVHHAAMAVATGAADVVVCYRALNERSGRRFGQVAVGAVQAPTIAEHVALLVEDGDTIQIGVGPYDEVNFFVIERHDDAKRTDDFIRFHISAGRLIEERLIDV